MRIMYEQEDFTMSILSLVGMFLLLLATGSGLALFFRAIWGAKDQYDNTSTLWGLFIVGLVAGIILVSVSG